MTVRWLGYLTTRTETKICRSWSGIRTPIMLSNIYWLEAQVIIFCRADHSYLSSICWVIYTTIIGGGLYRRDGKSFVMQLFQRLAIRGIDHGIICHLFNDSSGVGGILILDRNSYFLQPTRKYCSAVTNPSHRIDLYQLCDRLPFRVGCDQNTFEPQYIEILRR